MKKLLLASTALGAFGLVGPALAADLPVRKAPPPMVAPVAAFSWTGCYIGANVGGARGQKEWDSFGGSLFEDLFGGAEIFEVVTASGSVSFSASASASGVSLTGTSSVSSSFSFTQSVSHSRSAKGTFSATRNANSFTSTSDDSAGWLAGGQIGCDLQFAPRWVIGIEGDGEWASITGTVDTTQTVNAFAVKGEPNPAGPGTITVLFPAIPNAAAFSTRSKTEWLAAVTARLGYTPWDRWLFYVKGGAAWAGDKYNVSGTACSTFISGHAFDCGDFDLSGKETRFGWTTGLGIEYAFWNGWSAKLEYDHYDFGTKTVSFTDNLGFLSSGTADIRQRIEVLKFGINYRFNLWGAAPVVARY